MKRLAIICTHPIQYYAPLFSLLSKRGVIRIKVFYTWGEATEKKFDPGFQKEISWDIPLLENYDFEFLKNVSVRPGSSHFRGIQNPEIITRIANFSPHALLVFGWAYHSHLMTIKHFSGRIPVWFRGDSTILNRESRMKSLLKSVILRNIYKKVDIAFYVGIENKRYFTKFGLPEDRLVFAPHAIDNDRFSIPQPEKAHEIRNHLKVQENQKLLLFAGKFETVKQPLLLLNAFKKIKDDSAHLLFVGNGALEQLLKSESNAHSFIHFMDFQNQSVMPAFYQASDIFCLPSSSETWGLAVNEAMATGRPVLVSDKVGCAKNLVVSGQNGYVFESDNASSLAEKLTLILKHNRQTLSQMGVASRKRIEHYNFDRIAITIENQFAS